MYSNYIIDDNTVYEIDQDCAQNNNKLLEPSGKIDIEQEQVTFSAYIQPKMQHKPGNNIPGLCYDRKLR